ncbi:hypothetical protein [Roseibacillus ishigakijimensis]|uniref:Helix-turn-helix domain-containing protein n=1 Tax=Roseibacillus ishigakijimensis TaxID=454146 RepID=A0A934RQ13_9BACT|nr:hypothetical protein [Roseibacillus ishigakijimensis]MBK1835379.1 hypothetical protein [Roseibacillus ishigakijimensis]
MNTLPETKRRPKAGSQLETVLSILERAQGQEVTLRQFMIEANAGAAHSVIATLRTKYGFDIRNRMERQKSGVVHSFYRLIADNQTESK